MKNNNFEYSVQCIHKTEKRGHVHALRPVYAENMKSAEALAKAYYNSKDSDNIICVNIYKLEKTMICL